MSLFPTGITMVYVLWQARPPLALWYSEFVPSGVDDIDIGNISLYGVDRDGPVASTERDNTVSVPESIIQLTIKQMT